MKTRKKSFKTVTKELFFKYAAIPYLIIVILFSLFMISLINIKIIYDSKHAAKNIELKVSEVFQNYLEEIERMSELPQVYSTLETLKDNHLVYEEFYNFNNQNEVKSMFHLIDLRHVFLVSTAPSISENNNQIIDDILPYINKNPDEIYVDVAQTQYPNGITTVLNLGKAIIKDQKTIGYLVYQLVEDDFQQLIFGEKADIVVLTDDYDYIVTTTNSITTGLMNKFTPNRISDTLVKIKDDTYYFNELRTENGLFTIYTMNNIKNSNTVIYLSFFIFILITGILLYFLLRNLAEKMSSKNVQSIEKLMDAVAKLDQGDMKAYVDINTGDEFELLANQYNEMLDNLNELLKRNEELTNLKIQKEISLLESQFNPHFLFNVLETLKYTMYTDVNKAQEIILSLSRVLRYSLNANTHETPFERDLNYMLDYLKLHKIRFGERLDYKIDIDEELRQVPVPKLLLQPLIENSIKYGYKEKTHLTIHIEGRIKEDQIIFKVTDNGSGIDDEKLKRIKSTFTSSETAAGDIGIGLYNTYRRIVLQYGDRYGLNIYSSKGQGTKVIATLPYRRTSSNNTGV